MNNKKIRVRFAPSPTGQLHLGGARTALFNWLFAKKHNGKFLLRIEDTDKMRSKQEYTDQICDSIKWLGLDWDEEIKYQSERGNIYKQAIDQLLNSKNVYRCFCTKDKITEDRKQAELSGSGYYYPGTCRNLDKKVIEEKLELKIPFSVRIRKPSGQTTFNDEIYGSIKIDNNVLDDFIIARTNGSPVYNLVVVIDDNDMNISHVIRGEDHISNTAKQIMLYNSLELPIPEFAHLPMILGPDKKRLSKRHGATGVQEYGELGILPEVLINYLALLGWNPGTEQEIFTSDELIESFSIDRVQKKSAVFDERKLQWVSSQHIYRMKSIDILGGIRSYNPEWGINSEANYLLAVIDLMKERVKFLSDMQDMTVYFFEDPIKYDEKGSRKKWKDSSVNDLIKIFIKSLVKLEVWDSVEIEDVLRKCSEQEEVSVGKIIHPTRLALSGTSSGPSLFAMMDLLGKEVCIRRLKTAEAQLPLNRE